MENVQSILATNIQTLRKRKEMTQEALASALGVTFQAVSKWETAKSSPDVSLLPEIADVLECSLDALFSGTGRRDTAVPHDFRWLAEFPWPDDNNIRGVICWGRKILSVEDNSLKEYTFRISSDMDVQNIDSMCNVVLEEGSVRGNCKAGHTMKINGSVGGACFAGYSIAAGGDIGGDCKAGHTISANNVSGDCRAGCSVSARDITGDCTAGHEVNISGDLNGNIMKAKKITVDGKVIWDETDENESD